MTPGNGTGSHKTLDVGNSGPVVDVLTHKINVGHAALALLVAVVGAIGGLLAYFGGFARADAVDKSLAVIHAEQAAHARVLDHHGNRITAVESKIDYVHEAMGWQTTITRSRMSKQERRTLPPPPAFTPKEEE